MTTALVVGVLALLTGLTSKFADLLNEHGITWFSRASPTFGLVWAGLAATLTLTDPWVAAMWLGTVLFWFVRCKLDHFNHAVAGVCVVLASLHFGTELPLGAVLGILVWLLVSGEVQNELKRRYADRTTLMRLLRLRLRFYAGPFVLVAVGDTWLPAVAIVFGMLGTELVTVWHSRLLQGARDVDLGLGMRYRRNIDTGGFMPVPGRTTATAGVRDGVVS